MTHAMVIVGAGEAGARAATTLREAGYAGPVTLIGDEPHAPYERPPLSKMFVAAEGAEDRLPVILDARQLEAANIRHLPGLRVRHLDTGTRTAHLSDGAAIPYEKLLIATGSASRRLGTPGAEAGDILYLRSYAEAVALRDRLRPGRRLAVIGGGFIGLEVAAAAVARGCTVTLVEMAPRILMRGVPEELASLLRTRHEQAGVRFLVGTAIERIERQDGETRVVLADGAVVACDLVLAGVGALPETALAEASGLAVENGVRVDGSLRTSDPHVFAAGDCCSFPHPLYAGRRLRLEAWRNAQAQGALAARNMLGAEETYDAVPWFWSDQHDLGLQVAGLADEGTALVRREDGAARLFFHLADDGRLVGASGLGPGNAVARDIKLAEMMIARRLAPDPTALADPAHKLKSLLTTAPAAGVGAAAA